MSGKETEESREQKRDRQTKEQFEALGKFVQSFEQMVAAVKSGIGFLSGITGDKATALTIILNHKVMTAQPLFDIFRVFAANAVNHPEAKVPKKEIEVVESLLKNLNKRYQEMYERRNDLLHGTWFIGWHSQDQEDFSKLNVYKHKVSAKGLISADLPKNTDALASLQKECEALHDIIFFLSSSIIMIGYPDADDILPSNTYYLSDGKWYCRKSMSR